MPACWSSNYCSVQFIPFATFNWLFCLVQKRFFKEKKVEKRVKYPKETMFTLSYVVVKNAINVITFNAIIWFMIKLAEIHPSLQARLCQFHPKVIKLRYTHCIMNTN